MGSDFTRYLLAKRTVDDRALDRHALDAFVRELRSLGPRPPRVLELGAGLGTMVARLADWGLVTEADYTLLDEDEAGLAEASKHLAAWAAGRGLAASEAGGALRLEGEGLRLGVEFRASELGTYLREGEAGRFDAVSANAFLDLVDVPRVLPGLWRLCRPGAPFWFSINFDGETIFLPEDEHDGPVIGLYHQSMGEGRRGGHPEGDSRAGRRLFGQLRQSGAEIRSAGGSDSVVFARGGAYPADEAYFVEHILEIVRRELDGRPELAPGVLDAWVGRRRRQLEEGELVYIARQLDFSGRAPR
jgi:SAM-dependent methyltransferase